MFLVVVEGWIDSKVLTNRWMCEKKTCKYYNIKIGKQKNKTFYAELDKFQDTLFFTIKKDCIVVKIDVQKVHEKQRIKDVTLKSCGCDLPANLDPDLLDKKLTFLPS